jgi:hypothetical protein
VVVIVGSAETPDHYHSELALRKTRKKRVLSPCGCTCACGLPLDRCADLMVTR